MYNGKNPKKLNDSDDQTRIVIQQDEYNHLQQAHYCQARPQGCGSQVLYGKVDGPLSVHLWRRCNGQVGYYFGMC